jgi:hypothetical protein
MSGGPRTVRPWIKRELASYRPGIDWFEGLREPTEQDVERARLGLELTRLDVEIEVQQRIVHAERAELLQRLGFDVTNYRPLRDAPAPRSRGPIMEGRLVRPIGQVLGVR